MTHLDPSRPATVRELRNFGLLVGGAFITLAVIAIARERRTAAAVFGVVGSVLFVAGLAWPRMLARVHRAWMSFAVLLSRVTTPIFMGAIYFLVITPAGIAMRLAGRSILKHGRGDTEWTDRPVSARRSALERQF